MNQDEGAYMDRTRKAHLYWSKRRALAMLKKCKGEGGINNVFANFHVDLMLHPQLEDHNGIRLAERLIKFGKFDTLAKVQEFIEAHR